MPQQHPSNCSTGSSVDFYWHASSSPDQDDHIEAAVEALWQAIQRPGERGWRLETKAMARAEFRGLLREAAQGELEPVDQVKELGDEHPVLFEIRWQTIDVVELGPPLSFKTILVRLIHIEPDELGLAFVGLHAHEKLVIKDRGSDEANGRATKDAQDAEIAKALVVYGNGFSNLWGQVRRSS